MTNKQSEQIQKMTDRQILINLYATQFALIVIAAILGFFLFPSWDAFFSLWEWNGKEIALYGGLGGFAIVVLDWFLMKFSPKEMYDDGGVNERIFSKRSVWHISIIACIVAISEEILFRGIIQSNFGIIVASIIFALLHLRYLSKLLLFIVVVLLSFFLGYLFEITENLNVTILAHFLIDFTFACIIRFEYKK
jgi:membrane protease YdiL (CAAX protease family)